MGLCDVDGNHLFLVDVAAAGAADLADVVPRVARHRQATTPAGFGSTGPKSGIDGEAQGHSGHFKINLTTFSSEMIKKYVQCLTANYKTFVVSIDSVTFLRCPSANYMIFECHVANFAYLN